ncbi:MAG: hypothetical protein D6705_09375 [Deltaproteobacteria bacterium]|nr:MAG: hypothetical protein D6705_09375 [Deltaproteobacteria bacterium]
MPTSNAVARRSVSPRLGGLASSSVPILLALGCSSPGHGSDESGTGSGSTGADTGTSSTTVDASGSAASDLPPPAEGTFDLLVYNVAGLPQGISGSNPETNIPMMSPLLDDYDLVLVQEDFSYHEELAKDATHPYQSEPKPPAGGTDLGDGLNRFSVFPFTDFERHAWEQCSGQFDMGSDCLTSKGFSVGLHELAPGVLVDVVNLHMDAGSAPSDVEARKAQVAQLVGYMQQRAPDRALVVAGDTNMDEEDEADFVSLLEGLGLRDACRELDCPDPYRIDRAMLRDSDVVELSATSWSLDDRFVTEDGEPLSDHEAVAVTIAFRTKGP